MPLLETARALATWRAMRPGPTACATSTFRSLAWWGGVLHALAGKRPAEHHGRLGFLARELLQEISSAMHDI